MKCYLFLFALSCFCFTYGSSDVPKAFPTTTPSPEILFRQSAKYLEKNVKSFVKSVTKEAVSRLLDSGGGLSISGRCTKAYMRFMADFVKLKMWALKMVDASSKFPAGVLEGTFTDYGSFDECLEIMVPLRNGSEDFRGRYCALEIAPPLPPVPRNYTFARRLPTNPFDTLGKQFEMSSSTFHYLKLRLGACIPSACSIDDLNKIIHNVLNTTVMHVHVSKCYVKEGVKFDSIHIVVISVLAVLVVLAAAGTILENRQKEAETPDSGLGRFLLAFSLISNSKRLTATSKSNRELRPLHAIRAMSMAWVILGHTYVWTSINRARRPLNSQTWFNSIEFEAVLNGWLSVEMFFFIRCCILDGQECIWMDVSADDSSRTDTVCKLYSMMTLSACILIISTSVGFMICGLLTCYVVVQAMEKSKNPLNVIKFIVHRYIRLTPPLLLTMGLVFFLPVIATGPFWHERVDSELESCRTNWWPNFLYIANTLSMNNICIHTMWYLSADFQMFVISLIVLFLFRRSSFFAMIALAVLAVSCNVIVFALTYIFELPPAILVSTGNMQLVNEEIDMIHVRTYSHAGPYYIGMVTGYLILKKKDTFQLKKWQNTLGWSASFFLSVTSLYGVHQWNTGHFHGPLLSSLYASMHRTTFTLGVAYVTFICVTGYGGPVNWILSRKIWVPFSKLTYMVYLLHGLVLWTRFGYIRERFYLSHYNMLYEFISNVVIVVVLSIPFYLLVEAPIDNLQRMVFQRPRSSTDSESKKDLNHSKDVISYPAAHSDLSSRSVELTSVTTSPAFGYKNGLSQFHTNGGNALGNGYH